MNMRSLGCLAFILSGCSAGGNMMHHDMSNSYSVEFREQSGVLYMPLWVPTQSRERRTLYHHPVCGVQIDRVEADGVRVDGQDLIVDYDSFDAGTFEANYRWHGYQVRMWTTDDEKSFELDSVSSMKKGDFDLKQYLVPANTTRILIRYRPRYPLDELGDPITAVA